MSDLITIDAVTISALGFWFVFFVARRPPVSTLVPYKRLGRSRAGPSVPTIEGTGLPFTAMGAEALGAMWTDQVQGIAVRVPVATVQGDPPRRTPPRC